MDYILKGYGMKILIIEDDKFYAKNLQKEIKKELSYETDVVNSLKELKALDLDKYDMFISDIFMENYDENYIEKNILPLKKPLILITAFPDKVLKEKISKLNPIDFIVKTNSNKFDYIIDKLKILNYIENKKCLIVDDSKTATLINMLSLKKHYNFSNIITAKDGVEGLEKLKENKDIKLILTDYEMPNMDGAGFIKNVRKKYNLDEKIIIAISSNSNKDTSTKLLKAGANDFLTKPFNDEELICRCDNTLKISLLLDEVRELAYKDTLSGLYNRRYFFDVANKMFLTSLRENKPITIIMFDIDHFKKINDNYGHQIGDVVIQKTSEILKTNIRKNDIACRYGGEEFVIFLYDCNIDDGYDIAEKIRQKVESQELHIEDKTIKYTISAGVSNKGNSIEEMIKNADEMLYKAKETRNCVVKDNI